MKGASSQPQLLLGSGPCPLDWVMVRKRLVRSAEARWLPGFLAGSSLSGAQHGSEDLLDDPHSVFIQEGPIYFSVNEQTFCYYQERPFQAQRQKAWAWLPLYSVTQQRQCYLLQRTVLKPKDSPQTCFVNANDATES